MKKVAPLIGILLLFLLLLPVSMRLADPLFSRPFDDTFSFQPVLLVWPDHVEVRQLRDISKDFPVAKDAGYTFSIPPERQAWVERSVVAMHSPNPRKADWAIRIKQVNKDEQRVDLELLGDGFTGITYEAYPDRVIPLRTRLSGAAGAIIYMVVDMVLVLAGWNLILLAKRLLSKKHAPRKISNT